MFGSVGSMTVTFLPRTYSFVTVCSLVEVNRLPGLFQLNILRRLFGALDLPPIGFERLG
jgi:hypothetical protein